MTKCRNPKGLQLEAWTGQTMHCNISNYVSQMTSPSPRLLFCFGQNRSATCILSLQNSMWFPCNNFPAIISVPHMSCQIKRHVTPSCTGESQFLWNALWHCRLQIATCAIVHSECHCTFQNALCPYCGLAPPSVCCGLQCVVRRPLLC